MQALEVLTQGKVEQIKHQNAITLEDRKEQGNERLERLKHALTSEREDAARAERKREICFIEAGQHMRALNAFMWQVPGLAIAVTGGLWFGASTVADEQAKVAVLYFAATIDVLLVVVILRIRYLFQQDLKTQLNFRGTYSKSGVAGHVVVCVWSVLLLFAAALGVAGALHPQKVIQRSTTSETPPPHSAVVEPTPTAPTSTSPAASKVHSAAPK